MLSVSLCFSDIEPRCSEIYFGNFRTGEEEQYKKILQLDDSQYSDYVMRVKKLFDDKLLDIDGRFTSLSDAIDIYNKYFSHLGFKLVSVSTSDKYFTLLREERSYPKEYPYSINGEPDNSKFLGFDILGWDTYLFHTFLCNALHEELPDARFNEFCLLDNTYEEVCKFSEMIVDLGEPVEWIPCRIGEPNINTKKRS